MEILRNVKFFLRQRQLDYKDTGTMLQIKIDNALKIEISKIRAYNGTLFMDVTHEGYKAIRFYAKHQTEIIKELTKVIVMLMPYKVGRTCKKCFSNAYFLENVCVKCSHDKFNLKAVEQEGKKYA